MSEAVHIDSLVIVIPVRNEEVLLPRCLTALARAIDHLDSSLGADPPQASVVIVLDGCTDRSAEICARWPAFHSLTVDLRAVGSARRAGVRHHLERERAAPSGIWLATTDADSAVPEAWLSTQLTFARNGTELVVGTVWPDDDLGPDEREYWAGRHTLADGHPHVHGANLGVRLDRYLDAGEFSAVESDEDVLLVAAMRALNVREARTALIPVLTSARIEGRAPGGFSGYLRA